MLIGLSRFRQAPAFAIRGMVTQMLQQNQTPKAVYLHIPFCTNKCHYCDFNSYILKGQPVMEYLDALEREMEQTVKAVPPGEIETIFVGGGTPTVLTPEQMKSFLHRYAPTFRFGRLSSSLQWKRTPAQRIRISFRP